MTEIDVTGETLAEATAAYFTAHFAAERKAGCLLSGGFHAYQTGEGWHVSAKLSPIPEGEE